MSKQVTLAEYLVGKVGLLKATKVAAFVAAWGIYTESEDGPGTMEGYTRYWGQSLSTSYKERDLFRICFPEDVMPDRVWAAVRSAYEGKKGRDLLGARVLSVEGSWR